MKLKITLFLFFLVLCYPQVNAQCSGFDFEEVNGIAILEAESKVSGDWRKESSSQASGGSALTYRGSNYFSSPGNSTITYKVKINSPGTYRFIWRSNITILATNAPANTEHNDSWLKIKGSNFYGKRGTSIVYPGGSGKTPVARGATSGGWFKIFTSSLGWNWTTLTSDNDGHSIYATFNSAGTYDIQISGRSNGHSIDRMVLYKEGSYSSSQAQSLSRAATNCSGGTTTTPPPTTPTPPPTTPTPPPTTPTTNQAPTVSITSPTVGQSISPGSNVTINLSANDADGSIAAHEIFVNNTRVDRDGTNYTPHVINDIQAGTYTIRAVVTDNGGKTGTSTLNITVGSGTGSTPNPNPTPPPSNSGPMVTITSPNAGQVVAVGSNVAINLSASDTGGSITRHQIFVNNSLVDTDGGFYTPHIISGINAGSYTITATVTDNDGNTASSTVNISAGGGSGTTNPPTPPTPPSSGNAAPTVQFTSLSAGQVIAPGTRVPIQLSANDIDGSVTRYQVFINNRLVDTDGSNYTPHPFQQNTTGVYNIRVVVTDNQGATGTAEINVTVGSGSSQPVPPPTTPSSGITFDLINASTNNTISTLTNGTNINSINAQGINIRANVSSSQVKSVVFSLTGARSTNRTEGLAPYALFGDIGSNYIAENLSNGSYSLTAYAYSGGSGSGQLLSQATVNFTVGSITNKTSVAFPNPIQSDGKVSLRLPEGAKGIFNYIITNSAGVPLEQGKFNTQPEVREVELELLNVGRQAPGVYYLNLMSLDSKQTIPLIKK